MGRAKRLESGIELRKGVIAAGGDDGDINLVFRLTDDEVVIKMPALKHPTLAEVKKDWDFIHSIKRDTSTEAPVTLRLSTVVKSTEGSIDSATYKRRTQKLRTDGRILGFQHRKWLIENQDKIADLKARAAIKAFLGKVYIEFSGIVVVDGDGDRRVPYVCFDGKRWDGYWHWFGRDFTRHGRIAVSSK